MEGHVPPLKEHALLAEGVRGDPCKETELCYRISLMAVTVQVKKGEEICHLPSAMKILHPGIVPDPFRWAPLRPAVIL